jgi:hypothetical protein
LSFLPLSERNAIFNAASKLRGLGEQLLPPHMKPL